jgi:hypothetical protein
MDCYNKDYGSIMLGNNNALFLVPHGFNGDEQGAHEIVAGICLKTSSYAVLNTKVPRQETNCNDYESIEKAASPVGRNFLADVRRLIGEISAANKKPTYVFSFHLCPTRFSTERKLFKKSDLGYRSYGSQDMRRPYDIDLGVGAVELVEMMQKKKESDAKFFARRLPPVRQEFPEIKNAGEIICDPKTVGYMCRLFRSFGVIATVGLEWPAMRKHNLMQKLHRDFPAVNFVQLECVAENIGHEKKITLVFQELIKMLQ